MLETKFKDFELESPLMNASGVHCSTIAELEELENSSAGAWISKTGTLEPREGNPEPRYNPIMQDDKLIGSINSMGLPNNGIDYYLEYLISLPDSNKPRFLSATAMEPHENSILLKKIQNSEYMGFTELNLSCPNVIGHPQTAYDFCLVDQILNEAFEFFEKPIGIKLPPYFDLVHIEQMAHILNKYPLAFINCVNSLGNGLYVDIDTEKVYIRPKNGFGGVGGEFILPTALANVRAFRERLNENIDIIGTGGVRSGKEAFLHILVGAQLVQIATQLQEEGVGVFSRINWELELIMKEKGYKSLEDFRGKVKFYD